LVLESSKTVQVVHVVNFVDVGNIAKIDGFNVSLHLASQFRPIETFIKLLELASIRQFI
jgi:hypothetical protein